MVLLAACNTESEESTTANKSLDKADDSAVHEMDEDNQKNTKDENTDVEESENKEQPGSNPAYEVTPEWFVKPKEDAAEKVVLLTIDDAPDEHAVEMAETLDRLNVPAIFFVNGHFLESEDKKEMLQKIDELGFPIGNHTMTHEDLTTLTEEEQKQEIIGVNEAIEEIVGEAPTFFRAPFGKNTDYSEQLVKEEGMLQMNWTYGYDFEAEYQNAEALTDIMVNTELLGDGAILLMHDRDWTNDALEDIVKGVQDQGYDMLDPKDIETEITKNKES